MAEIEIKEVKDKKHLNIFIHLPAKLNTHLKNWVPPVYMDDRIYFNPDKNKSFSYCDTILYLAYKNNKPVGRIMGIINHRYNQIKQEFNGRFCFFEGYEDEEVALSLLQSVENWVKSKGLHKIIGPFGFSDKDPQGFLMEGYDELPVIASNYNSPAAIKLMEQNNYQKEVDLFVYKVLIPDQLPPVYAKIYERATSTGDYNLIEFKTRKELKKYIRPIFTLVNNTFTEIYGFMPFEPEEMDDFAKRYLAVINPAHVKVVEYKGESIAFVIGMPDISPGLIKSKGYVFPFGFIHILLSQKRTKRLILLLGAIKPEFRGKGLDVLMGVKMIESAWKAGFKMIDSHHELEENIRMRAEMQKLGGVPYKKFRVFYKNI